MQEKTFLSTQANRISFNTFNTSFAPSPINPGKIDRGNRLIDFTDSCIEFYPKHDKMYAINSQNNYDNKVIIVDSKSVTSFPRAKKEKIAKIICKNIEKRI